MANRVAYDSDGSIAAWWDASESYASLDQAGAEALNGTSDANFQMALGTGTWYASVTFPEPRDLQAYFASAYLNVGSVGAHRGTLGIVETSIDTTTGIDGTWVSHGTVTNPNGTGGSVAAWPSTTALSVAGIRGVRVSYGASGSYNGCKLQLFHVYATATAPTGRLAIWDPALDQAIDADDLAWGVSPRSSTAVQQFRVKNTHGTDTAQSIDLSTTILTDSTPSLPPQLEFSSDGTNFSTTLNIGNLSAGATSGVLYYRRSILSNAELGYWMPRIVAQAGSWV